MDFRRQDGAISVYLSIVFLVIIALAGTIVDAARIRIGESQVKRAAETAAMSTLAGYLKPLKDDYGLFALAENDSDQLKSIAEEYMNGNLMTGLGGDREELARVFLGDIIKAAFKGEHEGASFANLFDYRIDDTEVIPCYNLTENEVVRNQITEFMKYRAPKQFAAEIANKSGLFGLSQEMKKVGKASKALNKKTELYDLLGKLGSKQIELADYVNTVKLFPISSSNEYKGRSKGDGALLRKYTSLDREYRKAAEAYLAGKQGNGSSVGKNAVNSRYAEIEISLKACRLKNEKCMETAGNIIQLKRELKNKLSEYDQFVLKEKDSLDGEFVSSLEEELELAREAISEDNSELAKLKAGDNLNVLNHALTKLPELNYGIDSYDNDAFFSQWDKMSAALGINGRGQYDNSFVYNYLSMDEWKAKKGKSHNGKTSRKDTRDEAEAARKEVENGDSTKEYLKEIDEAYYNERPSLYKDGAFINKSESQLPSQKKGEAYENFEDNGLQGLGVDSPSLGKSGDFTETDISGIKTSWTNLEELGEKLNNFLVSARDEIYINEYVMGMLTNDVPVIRKKTGGSLKVMVDTSKDLRLREKASDRKAYLKHGEVEYVLFGMKGEQDNIKAVSLAIGGLRFGINLAALHKMPKKMEEATIIAEAIAASIAAATAGAGAAASAASINAIREAVLAGWASLEAYQDVKYLKQGRMIPVWKDENTWITDEDGGIKAVDRGDAGSMLLTSYHDYLRLFLAIKSIAARDGKLNNIQDIIQYNIRFGGNKDFRLADYNTYVHINVKASMRYLFMTYAFMPKRLKTEQGRHSFRTVLFQGY